MHAQAAIEWMQVPTPGSMSMPRTPSIAAGLLQEGVGVHVPVTAQDQRLSRVPQRLADVLQHALAHRRKGVVAQVDGADHNTAWGEAVDVRQRVTAA